MDRAGLLLNISELNHILQKDTSLATFLDRCVAIVARHFNSEVCSIYLFDPKQNCITLAATVGLNQSKSETVSLKLGEGLTGLALKELRTIMVRESSKHPTYRYFPGLNEEKFDAYLGVPILRGIERIGVIVVQRPSSSPFNEEDAVSLRGVANQLAAMIDYARLLMSSVDNSASLVAAMPELPRLLRGRSSSGGWAYGNVIVDPSSKQFNALPDHVLNQSRTLSDFDQAITKTIAQLTDYQEEIEERLSDAASLIFSSHILLLQDEQFTGKIRQGIRDGSEPVREVIAVAEEIIAFFRRQDEPYFRQKAGDIRDIAFRIINNLVPRSEKTQNYAGAIIVASDLIPSDILLFSVEKVAGIILIGGGITSHVAILARSLKLPLVISDEPALLEVPALSTALIDAETGNIYLNPDTAVRTPFEQRKKQKQAQENGVEIPQHSKTADGTEITILANINLISDVADAVLLRAQGIGLYRTEFPFMVRSTFPTEEEQVSVYLRLIQAAQGLPVTFRTLDVGGDKVLSYYTSSRENNPFLGMRSIRFCLENRAVFKAQIRAILRAGAAADLQIMFPMISSVDELEESKRLVAECSQELLAENIPFHGNPRIGIMIELPSTVAIIDELARRCDFFSVGTNDLVQYMLAVDRTNEKVSKFYCPHHPAILRTIKRVAEAAQGAKIGISICGDMAHESRYLAFLVGIGIRTISIDSLYFPRVRAALQAINIEEASHRADTLLSCSAIHEVEKILL